MEKKVLNVTFLNHIGTEDQMIKCDALLDLVPSI